MRNNLSRTNVLNLFIGLISITTIFSPTTFQASADYYTYVTSNEVLPNGQTWEGFGTSLAWWANVFGMNDQIADLLFTTGDNLPYTYYDTTGSQKTIYLPGLGLQIVRYNIGGSSDRPTFTGDKMVLPTKPGSFPKFKQISGYWFNPSGDASSWDWYTDSNQRNMLWKARDRGVQRFEAFSDTPMWWMTINKSSAGTINPSDSCLQPGKYVDAAYYLATVLKYAHDNWGVNFNYVSPFNEPSSPWWRFNAPSEGYDGLQEGCEINRDSPDMKHLINELRRQLDNVGLGWIGINASEENSPDDSLNTVRTIYENDAIFNVGKVNTHGYSGASPYRGSGREGLKTETRYLEKSLWMSEYGDEDASGQRLAESITMDMYGLQPSGWVYWQALDGANWGLLSVDEPSARTTGMTDKYFVMAHFSRHIRTGMKILQSNDHNTVVAYDPYSHKLVIVTYNYYTPQYIGYDLAQLGGNLKVGGPVRRWITQLTGNPGDEKYRRHDGDAALTNGGRDFWAWFPAYTIQTFEVENVTF
ncbi:hypothetical protein HDU76_002998 [Blyttiomyces sp. JEL0837]|nr:hypothetical protein HDU76_002998 [Blyttiomyces sp. JEL0837]